MTSNILASIILVLCLFLSFLLSGMEVGVFAACTALIGRLGAVALASHQVALNTVSLTYMVPLGVASAAAVRVGQALGRGDPKGASRAGWTALALGMSFMFCMGVIFFLVPDYIVRIYTPDPQVIRRGPRSRNGTVAEESQNDAGSLR